MSDKDRVFAALSTVGIPGVEDGWTVGKAPPLPWFRYVRRKGGISKGDNGNYFIMPRFAAELYIKENDPALVAAFEDAVASLCPSFEPYEQWLDSEGCKVHRYEFTLLPNKEE